MPGTNTKQENPTKNIFSAVRGSNGFIKFHPKRTHMWPLPNLHTKFQLPCSIWYEKIEKKTTVFQAKKEGTLTSPLLNDLKSWIFGIFYTPLKCLSIGSKRYIFCDLSPSISLTLNLGVTEFCTEFNPTNRFSSVSSWANNF